MTQLPTNRSKSRRKLNGKSNGHDLDEPINEHEASAYLKSRGLKFSVQRLRESRMKKPRCIGPKFITRDGYHKEYTRRLCDEFIATRKPVVIDPAQRMARK